MGSSSSCVEFVCQTWHKSLRCAENSGLYIFWMICFICWCFDNIRWTREMHTRRQYVLSYSELSKITAVCSDVCHLLSFGTCSVTAQFTFKIYVERECHFNAQISSLKAWSACWRAETVLTSCFYSFISYLIHLTIYGMKSVFAVWYSEWLLTNEETSRFNPTLFLTWKIPLKNWIRPGTVVSYDSVCKIENLSFFES